MCYVILSRITCLSQLYLLDFDPKKIYCNENAKKEAKSIKERALNKKITEWDLVKENTIRVTTLNVRSLQKHYEDFISDDYIQNSDIICLQETWLNADPSENLTEFEAHFLNLKSKGIALFSKKMPQDVQKKSYENSSIIWATYGSFDIISVYRYSENHRLNDFTEKVMKLVNINRTVLVVGDFNLDLNKHPTNLFTKTLQSFGFVQLVNHPTHILGGIIDHVYFYSPTEASCRINKIHPVYYSDHDAVTFFLELER